MKAFPYVVQSGDSLLKLATRFGFDADAIWNLEANSHLAKNGRDPHVLGTGDVVYIPAPKRTCSLGSS